MSEWLVEPYGSKEDLVALLSAGFGLQWELTRECEECLMKKGGICKRNETTRQFVCSGDQGRTFFICLFFQLRIHVCFFNVSYLVSPHQRKFFQKLLEKLRGVTKHRSEHGKRFLKKMKICPPSCSSLDENGCVRNDQVPLSLCEQHV